MTKSQFQLKNRKKLFDFKSEDQELSKAKKKARVTAADKIFMEDSDHSSLMDKGKKMTDAMTEINKYTDY